MQISDIIDKPISVHVIAEMGAGKTTFLELLCAYQKWMQANFGLEDNLFHTFQEELPLDIWDKYQVAKKGDTPNHVIYLAQRWFMQQKLKLVNQAAGIGFDRKPGLYLVERSPIEDFHVFAGGLKHLFLPEDYLAYVEEFEYKVHNAPPPDIVARLEVTPEVSIERVKKRGYGELLELGYYYIMKGDYLRYVDSWIVSNRLPVIKINTGLPMFDFNTPMGQHYFLTTFIAGLYRENLWLEKKIHLPMELLIDCNG